VLGDGELGPQERLLRVVAQPGRDGRGAAVARKQPDDDRHQRALARAVLADGPDELARTNLERGSPQDIHPPPMPRRPDEKAFVTPSTLSTGVEAIAPGLTVAVSPIVRS
jgi:hypothetical protein